MSARFSTTFSQNQALRCLVRIPSKIIAYISPPLHKLRGRQAPAAELRDLLPAGGKCRNALQGMGADLA